MRPRPPVWRAATTRLPCAPPRSKSARASALVETVSGRMHTGTSGKSAESCE
ncbi:MAG: hypothetical protein V8Q82_04030 [Christensenellales bacterium]